MSQLEWLIWSAARRDAERVVRLPKAVSIAAVVAAYAEERP